MKYYYNLFTTNKNKEVEHMKIEKLLESHLKECSDIYIETFNSEPWNDNWDSTTSYNRLKDIYNTPGFYGLVVLEDDKIIAAVLGNIEHWYEGKMYNLKEMFVNQSLKRNGIGSSLMEALENSLKAFDVNSITLFTSKGDLTEKFYNKNGYLTFSDMIMMHKNI